MAGIWLAPDADAIAYALARQRNIKVGEIVLRSAVQP
jgi:hypothetical protein